VSPPSQPARVTGVLCAGNIVWDILVHPVDRIAWSTTVWVDGLEQHLGGNGANSAYALGRLGVPVRLLGWAGGDPFGGFAREQLASAGVDVSLLRTSTAPTATTVALVSSSADRMFLHQPGASLEAFADDMDLGAAISPGISHFHLANPFSAVHLRQKAPALLRQARELGLTTSLDTGWDSKGRWMEDLAPAIQHTGILFMNGKEACMLGGHPDPETCVRRLFDFGADTVVLKLGAAGCSIHGRDYTCRAPAFAVDAVDTTGAGDCFVGGFLAALHYAPGWAEAGRLANAAAGLSVQFLGAGQGLRDYRATRAWMESAATR
jgi:sugar/nucleoside kinase (ribokinase family)